MLTLKQGAEIFWLDEASIRSDDPLLRTWRLKGQTPTVKKSGQRQGINAISAVSNKGGFWYQVYTHRFNADVFIECLKDLIGNRRKPIYIITDDHPVHKGVLGHPRQMSHLPLQASSDKAYRGALVFKTGLN